MGGLFGNLLELGEWFGEKVLFALVGKSAVRRSKEARIVRILFGAFVIGIGIGLLLALLTFAALFITPFVTLAVWSFLLILEYWLKQGVEEDE